MGSKREPGGIADVLARFLPTRARDFAILALAATIAGIFVNALVLQRQRHATPLFSASAPAARNVANPPPASSAEPSPVATAAAAADAAPPARAADLDAAPQAQATAKPRDPIASMLRGEAKDQQRLVAAAGAALTKLDYSIIKSGGAVGAETLAAARDYEKAHGMPVSTEITPRVVKQLVAAANASASR